jgi:hypothetical protein
MEAQRKAVAGAYQREGKRGPVRMVVRRKDELCLAGAGQLPFPLLPLSRARFRFAGRPVSI